MCSKTPATKQRLFLLSPPLVSATQKHRQTSQTPKKHRRTNQNAHLHTFFSQKPTKNLPKTQKTVQPTPKPSSSTPPFLGVEELRLLGGGHGGDGTRGRGLREHPKHLPEATEIGGLGGRMGSRIGDLLWFVGFCVWF